MASPAQLGRVMNNEGPPGSSDMNHSPNSLKGVILGII